MANSFGGGGQDLDLSNGATDVFLSVLQFALSDLADDPWRRALAQWVAWHDQTLVGRGVVGFDLEDVHWDPAEFASQKAFLLQVIDFAATRHRWSELCYDPPHAVAYLQRYREVVAAFELPPGFGRPLDTAGPGPRTRSSAAPATGSTAASSSDGAGCARSAVRATPATCDELRALGRSNEHG